MSQCFLVSGAKRDRAKFLEGAAVPCKKKRKKERKRRSIKLRVPVHGRAPRSGCIQTPLKALYRSGEMQEVLNLGEIISSRGWRSRDKIGVIKLA